MGLQVDGGDDEGADGRRRQIDQSGTVTREQMAAFLYRIVHPVNPPPYPAP